MIGLAFFFMVMGIFTVALDMFLQVSLDDAVRAATREVQIWGANGNVVNSGSAVEISTSPVTYSSNFATLVCNEFGIIVPNCLNSLQYSVQVAPNFAQMYTVTLNSSGNLVASGGGSIPQYGSWVNGTFTNNATSSASATAITATAEGTPQFMLVQVAYPLPFSLLSFANYAATENGTTSLYSAVATVVP